MIDLQSTIVRPSESMETTNQFKNQIKTMHKQFMYEKKNKFNKPKKSMKSFNEKRKYIYGNKISEEKR